MALTPTDLKFARETGYEAWLSHDPLEAGHPALPLKDTFRTIVAAKSAELETAVGELSEAIRRMFGFEPAHVPVPPEGAPYVALGTFGGSALIADGFPQSVKDSIGSEGYALTVQPDEGRLAIGAGSPAGVLYGVFHLLRCLRTAAPVGEWSTVQNPVNPLRMINHWDNMDGSIERGYAGRSIFFKDNEITTDYGRVRDYARLLASVGINALTINNVNVHRMESRLITEPYLQEVAKLAAIFRSYGLKLFLSVNYASPMELGGLPGADPLDPEVRDWWKKAAAAVYAAIPDFGGFVVKADSENRPGPFTYGRNHADGSNMLAEALEPYGGIVIWRCFVYNCKQDWRDRKTDRARAAYDHFKPLDGRFKDNVVLQIKNGPMDFQVREPVSPLLGALARTNAVLEFQITQEYTGQQRHLCYLVPQWKDVLDFETYAAGPGSPVKRVVDGSLFGSRYSGIAAVSNIGDDANWTGHLLAQANLHGYGRLIWNPELTAEELALEWSRLTFGRGEETERTVVGMLLDSWGIYEAYTAPLGVGWMVNPNHHYGPNVDGYEYSMWGTYHYADSRGIGVDRTVATGTGYTSQYQGANADRYDSLEECPDELLLFFHHVPYSHVLHSGKTVIQHIYDTHFEGAERATGLQDRWSRLEGLIPEGFYRQAAARLAEQAAHACEWRDQINTYFYRKSGITDERGRTIY